MLLYLFQGIGYGFSAAVQPGPFQTFIISQTLNSGWRATLRCAFAPLISDGPIITLVLLILSQVPHWFQSFLYLAGGLFILYLAWSAFRNWRRFDTTQNFNTQPNQQSLFKAVLMNFMSPGPYIYWSLVTGPIFVRGWQETAMHGITFLIGFYVTLVSGIIGIIILFGLARQIGPRINRILLGISAVALFGFGMYQIWMGCRGILI